MHLAIHGAAGRMGQRIVALAAADPQFTIVAALEAANHPKLGQDAGTVAGIEKLGVPLSTELPPQTELVIDFSVPLAAEGIARRCLERNLALVMATTGLSATQHEFLRQASAAIPILWAPSMSLAVNLAIKLCTIAGQALKDHPSGVDVEIIERHHRFKEDAPSGTALLFGKRIAEVMGQRECRHGRQGQVGKRPQGEIGYHAVRAGDNPGEHTIVFGLLGETLEIKVAASNRDCYAQGALAAAKFLHGKPPGLYSMADVLGPLT